MAKTIAFFCTPHVHEYTISIRNGLRTALLERGYSIVYLGAAFQENLYANPAHVYGALETSMMANFDGYVVMAGIMRQVLARGHTFFKSCIDLLPPEKTLLIEDEVEGFRCLSKDNAPGMREVFHHVIDVCGRTKVGFVSGPEESKGARAREQVYFEEMVARDLPIQDRWFVRGKFQGDCADIIDAYVEQNPDLEAIVCATDALAFLVYDALRKCGRRPGVDVAVSGHDDQPRAASVQPPLTTVSLDPFDFGYTAGCEIANLVEGRPQEVTRVRGHLVRRLSCGEPATRDGLTRFENMVQTVPFPSHDAAWQILETVVKRSLVREDSPLLSEIETFVDACYQVYAGEASSEGPQMTGAGESLMRLADASMNGRVQVTDLQNALNDYLQALLFCAPAETKGEVAQTLALTNRYLMSYFKNLAAEAGPASSRLSMSLSAIVHQSLNSADKQETIRNMMEGLVGAGCTTAYLFLYDTPVVADRRGFNVPPTVRRRAVLEDGKVTVFGDDAEKVEVAAIGSFAKYLNESQEFCAIGLCDGDELLGYFAVQMADMSFSQFYLASLQITYVLRHVEIVQEERELVDLLNQTNAVLKRDSQCDAMTGLLNRRGFAELLSQRTAHTTMPTGGLFILDLDRFKLINDELGHETGDDAIISTAHVLQHSLREDDLVCRMGGDEFLLFVALGNEGEAHLIHERIEANLDRFNREAGKPYDLHASMGSVCFPLSEEFDWEALLALADEQLYEEKRRHHAER